MKKITLTPKELKRLLAGDDEVEGFENWNAEADHSSGHYDGEKGAMVDYNIYLYDPNNVEYVAKDGYFTGGSGDYFSGPIVFIEKVKKVKKVKAKPLSKDQKIKNQLSKILEKSDIKLIKKLLKEIENDVK